MYIDEVGFNQDFVPRYSYSKSNQTRFIETMPKKKKLSVIAAISWEGLIGFQMFEG